MNLRHLLGITVGLLLLPGQGIAQDKESLGQRERKLSDSKAPVTQEEARSVFLRTESIVQKALGKSGPPVSVAIPASTSPVTRAQVVAEFSRIVEVARPSFKVTPRPVTFDAKRIKMTDSKQRANLERLIRMGAVAKVGPLATGPTDALTVREFGDALGFFLSRLAEMTHMPSRKWTPALQDATGG